MIHSISTWNKNIKCDSERGARGRGRRGEQQSWIQ